MEVREPLSRSVKALLLALLTVPVALGIRAGEAGDVPVPVPRAMGTGDERVLISSVCLPRERLDIDVREDARTVTVTVTALDYDPDDSDGCESAHEVLLAQPLGGRRLVDGATGAELPVTAEPGS